MTPVTTYEALLPDDERAAPGALALVQALVNTLDRESGADALARPEDAHAWLRRAGVGGRVDAEGHVRLLEAREGLRELLSAASGHDGATAARAAQALRGAGGALHADVGADGAVGLRGAGEGVDGLLGDLLAAVHDAQVAGTWARLKTCADPGCRWAFYDASRNRAGAWCSMAGCGNRAKARALRARRAGG